jgi:hypothetical protein
MDKDIYKGWEISYNPPPIPVRSYDWIAMLPEYEAWTEAGCWVSNGLCLHAPNRAELTHNIDEWEAEMADA